MITGRDAALIGLAWALNHDSRKTQASERVPEDMTAPEADALEGIVVYWRPGCGFCSALGSDLDRLGVNHRLVNIWENPTAAAYVRSIARGNETVPTVSIGRVALVNPSTDDVLATAMQYTPGLVPEGYVPRRTLGNWIRRRLDR